MKKRVLTIILLVLSFSSFSQVKFEKGYFIDSSGIKTECYIKNKNWRNNPSELEYKLSIDSDVKTKTIRTIKEFAILPGTKYKRFEVNIDQSTQNIKTLGENKEPEFVKKTVLLKYLVEGKATLFLYQTGKQRLYFYSIDDSEVIQLVYKSYKINNNQIAKNRKYRQQLWNDIRCEGIKMNDIQNLKYTQKSFIDYFNLFNATCGASKNVINYTKKEDRNWLHLSIRPGIRFSSLSTENIRIGSRQDFGNKTNFRFGVEAEIVLPFNKNKWSFIIEPTFQTYKANQEVVVFESEALGVIRTANFEADYKSIELPLGVRYGFYINDNSKIYINGSFIFDFAFNSKISSNDNDGSSRPLELKISSSPTFAFGIGYTYKNKYTLEARYNLGRDILSDYVIIDSEYKSTSLIFGYTLF